MALYKEAAYLQRSGDSAFDEEHPPGGAVPHSGIYCCMPGCWREIVAEHAAHLPQQNHHQHEAGQGPVRWRLIVYADHRSKIGRAPNWIWITCTASGSYRFWPGRLSTDSDIFYAPLWVQGCHWQNPIVGIQARRLITPPRPAAITGLSPKTAGPQRISTRL